MTGGIVKISLVDPKKRHECAWCSKRLTEAESVYGLKTRFRKPMKLAVGEERCIPINILHIDREVPAFVRLSAIAREAALMLTFRTCSQDCAETLHSALVVEKRLFAVPLRG